MPMDGSMASKDDHSDELGALDERAFYDLALDLRGSAIADKLRRLHHVADIVAKGSAEAVTSTETRVLEASVVFNEIGRVLSFAGDPHGAIAAYKRAFIEAQGTGRSDQIYKALHCLGLCCLRLQDYV